MKKVFVLLILVLSILSGCIGKEEINDLAMVMAVGIDRNRENNNIILTAQIAKPGDVAGGSSSADTGDPLWIVSGEGETIFGAIRNIARFSSRRVFWAHNMIIVVNDDVAKIDGIVDIIDFFNRNNQLRMRTWIVVTEDKASEIIASPSGLEIIPGMSMDKLFRYTEIVSEAPRTDVMTLTASYLGEHTHPYLAMVAMEDKEIDENKHEEPRGIPQVALSGTAIFNKEKMVGKLNETESRGFLWFVEPSHSSIVALTCPEEPGRVSVELRDNNFDLIPMYENGIVSFEAVVDTTTDLVELGCPTELEHSEIMKQIEVDVEEILKEEIEMMLEKVQQEYKVDVVHFGRTFQGKYPKQWKEIKEDWHEIFPNIKVDVVVRVELNNPLLLENPTRPAKD